MNRNYISPTNGILAFLFLLITQGSLLAQNGFIGVFLTWKDDPVSSMVVDWHSFEREGQKLQYKLEGEEGWMEAEGSVKPFPNSKPQRYVHRVALQGLESDSKYIFRVNQEAKEYYFMTMPEDLSKRALRIAIGGDTMHDKTSMEKTNRVAMTYSPDFVLIGGDLAYADGDTAKVSRWYDWFDAYNSSLIADDGRVVPMVVAIGNHEVQKGSYSRHEGFDFSDKSREKVSPYFFNFFAFPGHPGYGVLDFGQYLSIIALDTEHANPVDGEQTQWLEQMLEERKDVHHLIPIYHVPAFPSVRNYDGDWETKVRQNFVPLFEQYGVRLAFENHDHAYKRTFPILGEEIHEGGIVYVGDGSWGTAPRKIHSVESTWYLKKAQSIRAFTILSLEGKAYSLIGVDENGRVIDSYPENPLLYR